MPISNDFQYGEMNAAAQRRPAPTVGKPALVWHRAFWKPDGDQISGTEWRQQIDKLLLQLFLFARYDGRLREEQYTDVRPDVFRNLDVGVTEGIRELHLFNSRYTIEESEKYKSGYKIIAETSDVDGPDKVKRNDRFFYAISIFGVRFKVHCELHHEYWTLTTILDFSEYEFIPGNEISEDNKAVHSIKLFLDSLDNIAIERSRNFSNQEAPQKLSRLEAKHDAKLEKQKVALIAEAKELIDRFILAEKLDYRPTGGLFLDSFGVVLGLRINKSHDGGALLGKSQKPEKSLVGRIAPDDRFDRTIVLPVTEALWPILRYSQFEAKSEENYGKPEYSISLLHRERCLFLSALGRVTPSYRKSGKVIEETVLIEPIIYFLVPVYQNRWQLGRVIEQLNNSMTCRVASVRSLYGISIADRKIKEIQYKLDAGHYSHEQNKLDLNSDFQSIGASVRVGTNLRLIDGDLQYRIDRSKYYVVNFNSEVVRLGVSRVEGFQPYDEFVGRRLNEATEFIERTGARYTSLIKRMRLESNFSRIAQNKSLQHSIEFNTERAVRFLGNAERVLIVPFTYYIGSIIDHSKEFFSYIGEHYNELSEHLGWSGHEAWSKPFNNFLEAAAMPLGFLISIWIVAVLERNNKKIVLSLSRHRSSIKVSD